MLPLYSTRSDIFQYQLTLLWYIDFVILEIITCDDIFQYLLIVKRYILIFLYWKIGLHPICKLVFKKRSVFLKKRLNWRKNRFVFGKMSRLLKKRLNFEKPSNKCNCFSRILVWINEIINEKTTHTFVFWKNE